MESDVSTNPPMGSSISSIPEATFDFCPDVSKVKEDTLRLDLVTTVEKKEGKLIFHPQRKSLASLLTLSSLKPTEYNYIVSQIHLRSYTNNVNLKVGMRVHLYHYDQTESVDEPIRAELSPIHACYDIEQKMFKHSYPKGLGFFAYSIYKDEILGYRGGDANMNNEKWKFVETSSPFYFLYKDSYNEFERRMRNNQVVDGVKTDTIVTSIRTLPKTDKIAPSNDYVLIHEDAISYFIMDVKREKYDKLRFVDWGRSFIEFTFVQDEIGARDLECFDVTLASFGSDFQDEKPTRLPVTCAIEFDYLEIVKNVNTKVRAQTTKLFSQVDRTLITMNIYDHSHIKSKNAPSVNLLASKVSDGERKKTEEDLKAIYTLLDPSN